MPNTTMLLEKILDELKEIGFAVKELSKAMENLSEEIDECSRDSIRN